MLLNVWLLMEAWCTWRTLRTPVLSEGSVSDTLFAFAIANLVC